MKYTTIIVLLLCFQASLALSKKSVSKDVFQVKPLFATQAQSDSLVVSVSAKCADVRLFKWTAGAWPAAQVELNIQNAKGQGDLSFNAGFTLASIQASLEKEKDAAVKTKIQGIVDQAKTVSGCKRRLNHRLGKVGRKLRRKSQAKAETLEVYSYILTSDASAITLSDRGTKYTDKTKQYFDDASSGTEYWVKQSDKAWNTNPTFAAFKADFKLPSSVTSLSIQSIKIYTRYSGVLPLDEVQTEMSTALAEPTSHTPSTWDAFKYFVVKVSIPDQNQMVVNHAFLEVCTKSNDNNFYRIFIDRGSRESALSDTWQTRIRYTYLGAATSCALSSGTWLINEVGKTDNVAHIVQQHEKDGLNVNFDKLITLGKDYAAKFPVYNTLVNCQHFAYNAYNLVAGTTLDYESHHHMKDHSDASGKQVQGKSVPFAIQLASFRHNLIKNKKNKQRRIHHN